MVGPAPDGVRRAFQEVPPRSRRGHHVTGAQGLHATKSATWWGGLAERAVLSHARTTLLRTDPRGLPEILDVRAGAYVPTSGSQKRWNRGYVNKMNCLNGPVPV